MVEFKTTSDGLIALLSGEIDHHSAKQMREEIDSRISVSLPKKLYLDFGGVTFMDSSGIGLIMGRFRGMQALSGSVCILHAAKPFCKVMRLAGLEKLVELKE